MTHAVTNDDSQGAIDVILECAANLDKKYYKTIMRGLRTVGKVEYRHLKKRVRLHRQVATASKEAGKKYDAMRKRDIPSWDDFMRLNKDMRTDSDTLVGVMITFSNQLNQLQGASLIRKTAANDTLTEASNLLAFAGKRLMGPVKHYDHLNETARMNAVRTDQPVSREMYQELTAFEVRIRTTLESTAAELGRIREMVANMVAEQRYRVYANALFKTDKDDIDHSIGVVEKMVKNVQAAASIAAIVTPEETASQVLEGATSIGQILINFGVNAARDWKELRDARKIMASPVMRAQAERYLADNPRAVLEYVAARNKRDLEESIDTLHPGISGLLMAASAALALTGVGAVVAKVVFPWVFAVVKTSVVEVFTTIEEARINNLVPQDGGIVRHVMQTVANLNQLTARELLGQGKADLEKILDNVWTSLKDNAKEKGLGVLTPDGISEIVASKIRPVVVKIIETIASQPVTEMDDATLLLTGTQASEVSDVEQKYA